MTTTLALHFIAGEPHVRDIDLGVALGMRRPMDIRNHHIATQRGFLLNCGPLHQEGDTYYLNEGQAIAILRYSTRRKTAIARLCVLETFRQFRSETVPQMSIVEVLLQGLAPFVEHCHEGLDGMVIDALRSKLRETVRTRRFTYRRFHSVKRKRPRSA